MKKLVLVLLFVLIFSSNKLLSSSMACICDNNCKLPFELVAYEDPSDPENADYNLVSSAMICSEICNDYGGFQGFTDDDYDASNLIPCG